MSNKLKYETSPYLLQHAENPVNWYPWCETAFETARTEDKPIFLSIGYSTCHWCHVMAHESFENNEVAEILNKNFISIKVDREERPDIDSVYMSVCQAFTGSGGWPMSIFITWDKKPFFAGTYFPVNSRYKVPCFPDLLNIISKQWKDNRAELLKSADKIINYLKSSENENLFENSSNSENLSDTAFNIFKESFDKLYGGFGKAPKFPTPHNLLFLMMYDNPYALKMAEKTLLQMRNGGIFDHIGYGFSRYSTDRYFLVPHFEKMLYDNSLLIIAYSTAYSITENKLYIDTAEKTAQYIINEMTSRDGGFYSAQDADSEGVEGKYYTFSLKEIIDVLGKENGKRFAKAFDITSDGNFEGLNIPNLLKNNNIIYNNFDSDRKKLYDYRKNRMKLHLDDKILASWNSMAIAALSMLYRITHNEKYLHKAKQSQRFIEENLSSELQLFTSWRSGKHSDKAFLDDYAFYIFALTELYNSTLENIYLEKAESFCNETIKRFHDSRNDGFYFCETDNQELFINPKEIYDGAIPSGNSVMAYNLVRLWQITENDKYRRLAESQLDFISSNAQEYPSSHSMFLVAKLLYEKPPEHITIVLKDNKYNTDLKKLQGKLPFMANVRVISENGKYPLINNKTTFYICKDHVCLPPVNTGAIL